MKLDAFTIVESIMAMIVIMISFTAGMTVYLSILKGDAFPLKTKAENILNLLFLETKNQKHFLDETLNQDGFVIEKKVLRYKTFHGIFNQENIYQISFKAYASDETLIAEQEHLVFIPNEQ